MMRPDSGTKSRIASNQDVNIHINELQQQLIKSQTEAKRWKDKLSCLVSLVRRSWNGDRNASIHLANIVGLDVPPSMMNHGTSSGPESAVLLAHSVGAEERAAKNWERLSMRLLQLDYLNFQNELHQQQQHYMEKRSRFMDEVMHFHQKDMARLPLGRPPSGKLSSVDQQFLQYHSLVGPDGKKVHRRLTQRAKSATTRRRKMGSTDIVEQMDVTLKDLFVDSTHSRTPNSNFSASNTGDCSSTVGTNKGPLTVVGQRRILQDYDDAKRYVQGNLFSADELLCRKQQPLNAAVMLEKDRQRARPRSAVTSHTNNDTVLSGNSGERPPKCEMTRPLLPKCEMTRPVLTKTKASAATGNRKGSLSSLTTIPLRPDPNQDPIIPIDSQHPNSPDAATANNPTTASQPALAQFEGGGLEDLEEAHQDPVSQNPLISVRVKNAVTRPESVDRFSSDLKQMEEMEAQFKKNTLALQKRLGLPESGIV